MSLIKISAIRCDICRTVAPCDPMLTPAYNRKLLAKAGWRSADRSDHCPACAGTKPDDVEDPRSLKVKVVCTDDAAEQIEEADSITVVDLITLEVSSEVIHGYVEARVVYGFNNGTEWGPELTVLLDEDHAFEPAGGVFQAVVAAIKAARPGIEVLAKAFTRRPG